MSIAAKMYKAGYMPKARNKSREDKEDFDFKVEGGREEKAADEEKEAGLVQQGPSASDKAASATWLKNRLKSKPMVQAPGTINSNIASMTGSRYANQSGLPYKMPKNMMSPSKSETKKVDFGMSENEAKTEVVDARLEVPVDSSKDGALISERKQLVRFMRSAKVANKGSNRLVRQCVHCCLLYSTSHACNVANTTVDLDAADEK